MVQFVDRRNYELKTAFSIRKVNNNKYGITFTENGQEYLYNSENIDVLHTDNNEAKLDRKLLVYAYDRECYNCKQSTKILTYIVFSGDITDILDNVTYPWNKIRALKYQDLDAHLEDPHIEYYGIEVIGDIFAYDEMMMKAYPNQIAVRHSNITHTYYPMNLCEHCLAPQGHYYVYEYVNKMIRSMEPISVINSLPIHITQDFINKCRSDDIIL